jgi:hypothetical protein
MVRSTYLAETLAIRIDRQIEKSLCVTFCATCVRGVKLNLMLVEIE